MLSRTDDYYDGIVEWVNSQVSEMDNTSEIGTAFCQWCLENIFELTNDEAIDAQEIAGRYDHGIDAFIRHPKGLEDKGIVVQAKYGASHSYSEITKFHYDMTRILEGKVKSHEANDAAQRVISEIQDDLERGSKIEFYYVTNEGFSDLERSKIASLPDSGTIFHFYDLNEIVRRLDHRQQDVPDSIRGQWFVLKRSTKEYLKFADTTAVIAVSLADMHDFVAECSNDLFASNVRQYLSGTKINSEIRRTIQENPERFWLFNNGITLVCDDFVDENSHIKIQTPQIVNGCQTAQSIFDILSKRRENDRRALRGHVLVRIIKGADETEKQNITRYTNNQNAVRGKDFYSLEEFQRKLQKRFKKWGYFYEIQKGSFTSLKASERAKYTGTSELSYLVSSRFKNRIPAMEAIQAFTSGIKQLPAVAYASPYHLTPTGSWYDKVIEETLEPEVRSFLYPYLIREWAKNNGYSRGGEGWRAHSASFFVYVYFIIVVEMLKRLNLVNELESSPEKISVEIWDRIFGSEQLNTKILRDTDAILARYFEDSKVEEAVGLDVRKFLKSQEVLNRHNPILLRRVELVIFSSRTKELIDMFASIMAL